LSDILTKLQIDWLIAIG